MKRAWLAAAVSVLGVAQAQAAPTLQFRFVQGGTVVTSAVVACNTCGVTGVTVGDYAVSVSGAWMNGNAGPGGSNIQSAAIAARRISSFSPAPLELYVTAVGYDQPTGPDWAFDATHAATKSGTPQSVAVAVSFEAHIDLSNAPFGAAFGSGSISCKPSGGGLLQSCSANGRTRSLPGATGPFSMTTRTAFYIDQYDVVSVIGSTSQALVRPR